MNRSTIFKVTVIEQDEDFLSSDVSEVHKRLIRLVAKEAVEEFARQSQNAIGDRKCGEYAKPEPGQKHREPALPETGFLRLPQVLELVPVGKTSWWLGVKSGRFPKPLKLSSRCTAWRAEDIRELIDRIAKPAQRD